MFIPCILISVLFISHTTLIRACQYIYTYYPEINSPEPNIPNHQSNL